MNRFFLVLFCLSAAACGHKTDDNKHDDKTPNSKKTKEPGKSSDNNDSSETGKTFDKKKIDGFLSKLSKDVMVRDSTCKSGDQVVAERHLDSFHLSKGADGNWQLALVDNGQSILILLNQDTGTYKIEDDSIYIHPSFGNDFELAVKNGQTVFLLYLKAPDHGVTEICEYK